jgi:hypothetical protein
MDSPGGFLQKLAQAIAEFGSQLGSSRTGTLTQVGIGAECVRLPVAQLRPGPLPATPRRRRGCPSRVRTAAWC